MALIWALVMASLALVQADDALEMMTTIAETSTIPQETTTLTPDKTVEPPFFIVTAPEKLRPYSEYTVSITILGTVQPVAVTIGLYGTEKDNNFIKTSVVSVEPNTTKLAKIQIKDLKPDTYNLTVQGDDTFRFESSTNLRFVDKFQSVFIQTDKAMYKPGHKVQFRVLVLDAFLKPSVLNQIDVILKDGANNRVKEWKKVEAIKGVYSDEIQLSSYPVLGDWTILVKSGGKEFSKKFTVAEYVLPKFEVIVDVPQHATYANSKVPVTVSAKYTYGQLVKGEATIKVRPQYTYYREETKGNAKTIKVDTVATTDVDVVEALGVSDNQFYERTVVFEVNFKEDLTGKVLNGSATLKLHHAKCKVDFVSYTDNLVPGEAYKTQLKISNWDDTPYLSDQKTPIKIRYGRRWSERENATWKEYPFPTNGVLELTFPTDLGTEFLNIEADYAGIPAFLTVSKKQNDEGKNPTNLDLVFDSTKPPKIGDTLELDIVTRSTAQFLVYHVIARHALYETKIVKLEPGQTSVHVSVPISQAMAPESHIIVYYVSSTGELVAAEKEMKVDDLMANYVKLSASPNETEPGQEAQILIESKPNSFVGLMGIDQSVILLKKGNDISREDVENEVRSYDNPWYGTGRMYGRGRRSFGSWYPGYSVKDVFYRSGTVVMTNSYIHEEKVVDPGSRRPSSVRAKSMSRSQSRTTLGGGAARRSVDRIAGQTVVVRSTFLESWIWDMVALRLVVGLEEELRGMHFEPPKMEIYIDIFGEYWIIERQLPEWSPWYGYDGPDLFDSLVSLWCKTFGCGPPIPPPREKPPPPPEKIINPFLYQPSQVRTSSPKTWIWTSQNSGFVFLLFATIWNLSLSLSHLLAPTTNKLDSLSVSQCSLGSEISESLCIECASSEHAARMFLRLTHAPYLLSSFL